MHLLNLVLTRSSLLGRFRLGSRRGHVGPHQPAHPWQGGLPDRGCGRETRQTSGHCLPLVLFVRHSLIAVTAIFYLSTRLSGGQRKRAASRKPPQSAVTKVSWRLIAASYPADASIIPLNGDGPASAEPSTLVGVTAISIVALTVCRSTGINPDPARTYVHTLSQSRR